MGHEKRIEALEGKSGSKNSNHTDDDEIKL